MQSAPYLLVIANGTIALRPHSSNLLLSEPSACTTVNINTAIKLWDVVVVEQAPAESHPDARATEVAAPADATA